MSNSLFLDSGDIERIRERIGRHAWAKAMYRRVNANARRGWVRSLTGVYQQEVWDTGHVARDKALVYRVSGRDGRVGAIAAILTRAFGLDRMSEPLDGTAVWSYGKNHMNCCWAYDLVKGHRLLRGQFRKKMEARFAEVLAAQREAIRGRDVLGNTTFWHAATMGVLGHLLGEGRAVAESTSWFQRSLERLQDGLLWPEAPIYAHTYVRCAMTILAEALLHNGGEDLYRYATPSGASLKSLYDSMVRLAFAHGRVATCGDNSSQAAIVSKLEQRTGHDYGDTFLWNNESFREANTYEIAYLRYRDPVYAWILSQNPKRDSWDHTFWGLSALTHGADLGEAAPPPARSTVYPAYGAAIVRSDETHRYWNSDAPAIFLRNGERQGHGHCDHFNLVLNAFGRHVYPDWFIQFDYAVSWSERTGRCNRTPYCRSIAAHNTVMVDGRQPDGNPPTFSQVQRCGAMQVIRVEGSAYKGVRQRRTLGLTPQYLLDVFELESDTPHRYDYLLHGFGKVKLAGRHERGEVVDLGADLGYGPIDAEAEGGDNFWVRPARPTQIDDAWRARFEDTDGIGSRVFTAGAKGTQVFLSDTPYFVSAHGWDDRPVDGVIRRMPLLVVRRNARRTTFIVVHQPFMKRPGKLDLRISRGTVTVEGEGFADEVRLSSWAFRRTPERSG